MKSKSNGVPLTYRQREASYLKVKMMTRRIVGILACLVAIACVAIYYLRVINEWLCIIVIVYCLANIFSANSFLQDIKVGNPWHRINGITAIAFYIMVVALIAYGFISKQLVLQF